MQAVSIRTSLTGDRSASGGPCSSRGREHQTRNDRCRSPGDRSPRQVSPRAIEWLDGQAPNPTSAYAAAIRPVSCPSCRRDAPAPLSPRSASCITHDNYVIHEPSWQPSLALQHLDVDVVVDAGGVEAAGRAAFVDREACLRRHCALAEADGVEFDRADLAVVGDGRVVDADAARAEDLRHELAQLDLPAVHPRLARGLAEVTLRLERRDDGVDVA